MTLIRPPLPVDDILPELLRVCAGSPVTLLVAPPGSGKSTRVPLALLPAPWLAGQSILMLQPRRVAATGTARYMSDLLGEAPGRTVGYTVRFERCVSAATRVEVVTEGILTRRLQADPLLPGVGLVIFDEFHERHLDSDLALALCRDAQLGLRPDLRLLVMSATLAAEPLIHLLGAPPPLRCAARPFPVEIHWAAHDPQGALPQVVARGVRRALRETSGDVLAFLPGVGEIRACLGELADLSASVRLAPLHGELALAEQEAALLPGGGRRVVLATNLAETSLTIDGIEAVVDSGWERRPRFDAVSGSSRLETVRISRASAEQRSGRAGRLGPGVCYRLWSEATHGALLAEAPPGIRQADLAPLALELARWGVKEASSLAWLDPPPAGHLAAARRLLRRLGLIGEDGLPTALGHAAGAYPAHPRIARLLVESGRRGCPALGAALAALLSERDPWAATAFTPTAGGSDLQLRLDALCASGHREFNGVRRSVRYWRERLDCLRSGTDWPAQELSRLLAVAFPDRLAQRRQDASDRYLMANGQGVRLSARSAARSASWLLALGIGGGQGGEGEVRLAHPLTAEEVAACFGAEAGWMRELWWDERAGRAAAREVRRIGAILWQERPSLLAADEAVSLLLSLVRQRGLAALPWSEAARQWQARIDFARRHDPQGDWPPVADEELLETLENWLGPALLGLNRWEDVLRLDLAAILAALPGRSRRAALERLAPERLEVPSGARVRLVYALGAAPVLAVRLQELFGLGETPRVGNGRVPVLVHLLSPAGRPLAITRDLRSFWENVYPEVRREMKGRYPRHPWPEDPWQAPPTRRPRPGRH